MNTIVIIGQGQLGFELTKRLLAAGDWVFTVSRTSHEPLSGSHQHISADLDTITNALELPESIHTLFYLAPPSTTDLHDQRLKSFIKNHHHLNIQHIIYISTTGVYGDSEGQWITEKTPTQPAAERSKRRLDAEQQLFNYQQKTSTPTSVLRCAAIYSCKTVNKQRITANHKPVIEAAKAPFTNRIHLDDLTEVCVKAMQYPPKQYAIYNVSDGHPSTTTEHAWLLADLTGVTRNKEISLTEAAYYYSPAYMSYLNESKKIDISKLKKELKPEFKFENVIDGISNCLNR